MEDLAPRLDTIIAILKLAHRESLASAKSEILADDTNAAILAAPTEWRAAGELQKVVMKNTGDSQATVKRRLAGLVDQGVLERRGGGGSVSYRSTNLF